MLCSWGLVAACSRCHRLNPELAAIARFRLSQVISSENCGGVEREAIDTSENHAKKFQAITSLINSITRLPSTEVC
jgi:hypothetical protein